MSKHRTLIRIGLLIRDRVPHVIQFTIPSWDHNMVISARLVTLPGDVRQAVKEHFASTSNEPFRCYAQVNLDAETWEDIVVDNWELA